jgi:hypothetical protein
LHIPRPKRRAPPADVTGATMRIATGEEPEDYGPEPEAQGKDPAAVAQRKSGGPGKRKRVENRAERDKSTSEPPGIDLE